MTVSTQTHTVYNFNTNGGTVSGPSFNILINNEHITPETIRPDNILNLVAVYMKATMDGLTLGVTRMNMFDKPKHITTDPQFLRIIRKTQKNAKIIKGNEYLFKQGDYLRWLNKIVPNDHESLLKIRNEFERIYDNLNPHYRMRKDGNLGRMWQN